MSHSKTSSAEHADNHRRLLFLSMFLLSLVFAGEAVAFLVDEATAQTVSLVRKILALLALLSFGITIYWKLRFLPKAERYYLLATSDSYANQMLNQACKTSWVLAIPFFAFAPILIDKFYPGLPPEFFSHLALFFLLGSCSLSFFILFTRNDPDDLQNDDH